MRANNNNSNNIHKQNTELNESKRKHTENSYIQKRCLSLEYVCKSAFRLCNYVFESHSLRIIKRKIAIARENEGEREGEKNILIKQTLYTI